MEKPAFYGKPDVGMKWDNIYSVVSFSSFDHSSLRLETVRPVVHMSAMTRIERGEKNFSYPTDNNRVCTVSITANKTDTWWLWWKWGGSHPACQPQGDITLLSSICDLQFIVVEACVERPTGLSQANVHDALPFTHVLQQLWKYSTNIQVMTQLLSNNLLPS